jgi:hypothetical protein
VHGRDGLHVVAQHRRDVGLHALQRHVCQHAGGPNPKSEGLKRPLTMLARSMRATRLLHCISRRAAHNAQKQ